MGKNRLFVLTIYVDVYYLLKIEYCDLEKIKYKMVAGVFTILMNTKENN